MPDVELKLPELQGKDIVEHFYNIGEKQSAPYRQLLQNITASKLPKQPKVTCILYLQSVVNIFIYTR